ncbi:MAG TPA: DUF1801 domain-containing protein [Gammaproteobacteria bacterium]|nr:DUF1801 domain-containing protein [Gammaproteobacteria bacterium]
MTGREEVFRLSGTARRHRAVEVWLTSGPAELKALARKWFARLRACGPDVRELIHDGCPVACADDAAFAYVNVFKSHVNVGFFHGAQLADPAGLLEGSGKRMRHVKLDPVRDLDAAALETLIDAAYADVKARLAAEGVIA